MSSSTLKKMYDPGRGAYEVDERWISIDAYTMSNLHPPTRSNHAGLTRALQVSANKGLPDIMTPPPHGKFFALQCRMLDVKHALEVGTLGGYSAIWLATENPSLHVTTIEFDPHHANVARKNIEAAGVSDRVEVILGAGMDVLPQLYADIQSGKRERLGFTFIDADKLNNWNYVDWAIKMSVPSACIVVDNVVAKGELTIADSTNPMVLGGREVVERVGKDERIDGTVLQTVRWFHTHLLSPSLGPRAYSHAFSPNLLAEYVRQLEAMFRVVC
jgi:predicted O-methyltransferase YrrM